MSPPSGDGPHTPESKATSGLAGVFKTFTNRVNRTPGSPNTNLAPTANALLSQQLRRGTTALPKEAYTGPAKLEQLYERVCPGQPLPQRVAAAEALRHVVEDFSLSSIMGIWAAAKDLTDRDLPNEARQAGFDLLIACVKHSDPSPLERRQFFDTISAPCNPADFHLQLSAMIELTNHGKNVNDFELVMMPLLTRWLGEWFKASAVARRKEKDKPSRSTAALGEETNLDQLFSFINGIVRFNFKTFQEIEIHILLEQVLGICKKTIAEMDIKNAISLMDNLVTYGNIPPSMLGNCLDVLCGAFNTLKDLADSTWSAISNLCKSHLAQNALLTLLDIIRSPYTGLDYNANTIRGAIAVVDKIYKVQGANNLPSLSFSLIMDAFEKTLSADSWRLELEILEAIAGYFTDEDIQDMVMQEEDWDVMLDILVQCSAKTTNAAGLRGFDSVSSASVSTISKGSKDKDSGSRVSSTLQQIISHLENLCARGDFLQKQSVINFFMTVRTRVPDSCAKLLIQHFGEEHLCYPFNAEWLDNSHRLIEEFFKDASRPTSLRRLVLQLMRDVYEVTAGVCSTDVVRQFVTPLFELMTEEDELEVLQDLAAFAVDIVADADETLADFVLDSLIQCVPTEIPHITSSPASSRVTLPSSRPTSAAATQLYSSTNAAVVSAVVRIFIQSFDKSASKARKAFDFILKVAQSNKCDSDARLNAMKLLFRLRSDWSHAIIITSSTESERLAATLNRNADSLDTKVVPEESTQVRQSRQSRSDEHNPPRCSRSTSAGRVQTGVSRSSTTRTASINLHHGGSPLWLYPDPKALPEEPPSGPSRILMSCAEGRLDFGSAETRNGTETHTAVLSLNIWLEVLISIIQQGGDWDVYSYVLAHLGAQLTNHTLFAGATPQIKMLRNVLCEQMKANSFYEPPSSSGAKKADVTVCIFHALTMLLTYHEHFSKNEEDEIVRTFMLGMGSSEKTAKSCIHALSICCHELPLSVSKSLNTILQKMSQIITQSHVAVHILEFLGCLARLPEVYVNFREDDYRTVFGICFRYLQYVRDQRQKAQGVQSTRTSYASERHSRTSKDLGGAPEQTLHPNASHDLPQYVYALAYHVVTFWFMSLKLADRESHVGWIMKNLVSLDAAGKETMDEQSQVTIDMMHRVTYSDFDETVPDPNFAKPSDGVVEKRSWLFGLSILTVETAISSGVSQLTKRQPSATTYTTYRSVPAPRPPHQIPLISQTSSETQQESSRAVVLPNHILLQLTSSSMKVTDAQRPIPLPNDDPTKRAISAFDRNSTVDGHKVGIIYVGEGQVSEGEILANVIGSPDYTSFLSGLGTLVRLKGAQFNTQGLDRESDMDGPVAYCWRDRVTEIVFHATTMMPTDLEHDPNCINKKRHTGNDFVNIIFNNSGKPFRFDTFPSDFNYVNIIITPESRASFAASHARDWHNTSKQYYKVQVMSKPGFPEISPAAETKVVSGASLPAFVRLLALNASVFSLVWSHREGGEHVSSWRNRLREILKLRERHEPNAAKQAATSAPQTSNGVTSPVGQLQGGRDGNVQRESLNVRRTSAATFLTESSHRSSMLSTATTATETDAGASPEGESLVDSYDFSKWA
ncbi:MAG: Tuberous sclerosis 2-like protein [Piccolia ochrophora]|nr:MAG: Tuberous sclerosis 2-like protein [Piccolia ochrophora]